MRFSTWLSVGLAALLGGCGDSDAAHARQAFDAFQDALLAKQREQVRWLLTRNSRPVLEHLPWDEIAAKQPLECLDIAEHHGRYELRVRDPNEGGRESIYVIVRENSKWRIDLLNTTTFNHTEVALPGPATRLVPKQLTPAEIEEIAAREASHFR